MSSKVNFAIAGAQNPAQTPDHRRQSLSYVNGNIMGVFEAGDNAGSAKHLRDQLDKLLDRNYAALRDNVHGVEAKQRFIKYGADYTDDLIIPGCQVKGVIHEYEERFLELFSPGMDVDKVIRGTVMAEQGLSIRENSQDSWGEREARFMVRPGITEIRLNYEDETRPGFKVNNFLELALKAVNSQWYYDNENNPFKIKCALSGLQMQGAKQPEISLRDKTGKIIYLVRDSNDNTLKFFEANDRANPEIAGSAVDYARINIEEDGWSFESLNPNIALSKNVTSGAVPFNVNPTLIDAVTGEQICIFAEQSQPKYANGTLVRIGKAYDSTLAKDVPVAEIANVGSNRVYGLNKESNTLEAIIDGSGAARIGANCDVEVDTRVVNIDKYEYFLAVTEQCGVDQQEIENTINEHINERRIEGRFPEETVRKTVQSLRSKQLTVNPDQHCALAYAQTWEDVDEDDEKPGQSGLGRWALAGITAATLLVGGTMGLVGGSLYEKKGQPDKLTTLEAQIDSMQKETEAGNEKHRKEAEESSKKYAGLEKQFGDLKIQQEKYEKQIAQLQKTRTEALERAKQLEADLQKTRGSETEQVKTARTEMEKYKNAAEQAQEAEKELRAQLKDSTDSNTQLQGLQAKVNELTAASEKYKSQSEQAQEAAQKQRQATEDAARKLADLTAQHDALKNQLPDNAKAAETAALAEKLTKQVGTLEAQISDYKVKLNEFGTQVNGYETTIAQLKGQVESQTAESKKWKDLYDNIKTKKPDTPAAKPVEVAVPPKAGAELEKAVGSEKPKVEDAGFFDFGDDAPAEKKEDKKPAEEKPEEKPKEDGFLDF